MINNRHLLEELEREFLTSEKRDLQGNLELLEAMWEEAVQPASPSAGRTAGADRGEPKNGKDR